MALGWTLSPVTGNLMKRGRTHRDPEEEHVKIRQRLEPHCQSPCNSPEALQTLGPGPLCFLCSSLSLFSLCSGHTAFHIPPLMCRACSCFQLLPASSTLFQSLALASSFACMILPSISSWIPPLFILAFAQRSPSLLSLKFPPTHILPFSLYFSVFTLLYFPTP